MSLTMRSIIGVNGHPMLHQGSRFRVRIIRCSVFFHTYACAVHHIPSFWYIAIPDSLQAHLTFSKTFASFSPTSPTFYLSGSVLLSMAPFRRRSANRPSGRTPLTPFLYFSTSPFRSSGDRQGPFLPVVNQPRCELDRYALFYIFFPMLFLLLAFVACAPLSRQHWSLRFLVRRPTRVRASLAVTFARPLLNLAANMLFTFRPAGTGALTQLPS